MKLGNFGFEGGGTSSGGGGGGGAIKQNFTATAGQTTFTFTVGTLTANSLVQIGGITIDPALYSISGSDVILDPQDEGTWVAIIQLSGAGGALKENYVATAAQTTFTFTLGTLTDNSTIIVAGATMMAGEYTRSGQDIVLPAQMAGTQVMIIQLS